ncbi:lipolytic enzyme [Auriculariales sp. MPI-PUGE-AT-0066]|nr:lipolytic enzyme [Auriculariales sp. MPI-PUGE-AT-0066]
MLVHLLAVLLTVLSIAWRNHLSGADIPFMTLKGQCGGQGWTGATTCVAGATCTYSNPWYSQCLPGSASSSTTATSTTTTTTSGSSTSTSSAPGSTSTTGLTLRLLPLGDSITYGVQSSDGTGYRNTLHKLLEPGNTVDFIGSVKAGTMTDNDNEGHSGWTIDQIAGAANYSQAMPSKPNVVALHAGTNDIYGGNFGTAINRLTTLVDNLTLGYPSTVLLLSTIIPYPASQSSVDQFNTNITNLVTNRAAAGRKIVLASMSSVLSSDLADGVHPNDNGYKKMANAWYAAFATAAQKGWIVAPQ